MSLEILLGKETCPECGSGALTILRDYRLWTRDPAATSWADLRCRECGVEFSAWQSVRESEEVMEALHTALAQARGEGQP